MQRQMFGAVDIQTGKTIIVKYHRQMNMHGTCRERNHD